MPDGDLPGVLDDELFGGLVEDGGTAERGGIDYAEVMERLLDWAGQGTDALALSQLGDGH